MEMTSEVIAALQVLKDNAENDFENLVIERCERDLVEPPKVEVIDEKHQSFNGVTFRKFNDGHFYCSTGIHRYVYEYYFGKIPRSDYDVHHKDFNPVNNDIENLVLLQRSEHLSLHRLKDKHFAKCLGCGKEFEMIWGANHKYCSRECYIRNVKKVTEKKCVWCGKEFLPLNKNQKCCCRACGSKLGRKTQKETILANAETIECAWCGKKFLKKNVKNKFCSKYCSEKYRKNKK